MTGSDGLMVMLEMAGCTIAALRADLESSEALRVEQEGTIEDLREQLIAARAMPS